MAAMVVAGKRAMNSASLLCVFLCFCQYLWWGTQVVEAHLKPGFYAKTCPRAEATVRSGVQNALAKDKRMGASLLRLHFHDCFVQGCDGSVLLDGSSGEQEGVQNKNSLLGFEVVDSIKSQLESACPGTVSCADILALAARDSVVALGGPSWSVRLGRRDSRTSSKNAADNDLPSPNSTLAQLKSKFSANGLNSKDLVALSGAHTIGQARCFSFRSRIYNDANINRSFASSLKSSCPSTSGNGDQNLVPLDSDFDNNYFKNLLLKRGLLHSDQQLFPGSTAFLVRRYASNQNSFFSDFASAMIKMGNISPLTGSSGEIRKNCGCPN